MNTRSEPGNSESASLKTKPAIYWKLIFMSRTFLLREMVLGLRPITTDHFNKSIKNISMKGQCRREFSSDFS